MVTASIILVTIVEIDYSCEPIAAAFRQLPMMEPVQLACLPKLAEMV